MSVRSDKAFSRVDFIDRKLLSILSDIAGVMIEGGYEHMLRKAIDRHSAQLARYAANGPKTEPYPHQTIPSKTSDLI